MTTFKAIFSADNLEDLKTFLVCGLKYPSTKRIKGNQLLISWVTENNNASLDDLMKDIDMNQAEAFNLDLVAFYKTGS